MSYFCFISFQRLNEECLYSCLNSFLIKHKLLFKMQFGFINDHSTIPPLISFIGQIKKKYWQSFYLIVEFLSTCRKPLILLTMPYSLLVYVSRSLLVYGIRGLATSWSISFLKNWKRYYLWCSTRFKIRSFDVSSWCL